MSDSTSGRLCRSPNKAANGVINLTVAANRFLDGTMLVFREDEFCESAVRYEGDIERENLRYSNNTDNSTSDLSEQYMVAASGEIVEIGATHNAPQSDSFPCDIISVEKKPRPQYKPSRPPLLPPCRVCGDRASGFHYGVNTCEACKGFFRRSICKTEPYVCCNGTQDCRIAPGKRTACSHCRYKRCLEVGMSKGAIKTGRYTHELRSKNILEVKMLEKQNGGDTVEADRVHDVSSFLSKHPDEDGEKLDSIQRLILEETCGVLVSAQKFLFESLDEYFQEDLMLKRQNSVFLRYQNKKFSLRTVAQTCPPQNASINGEITRGESPVSDAGVSTNNTQSSGQGHGLNSAEEPFGDDGRPLTDVSFLRNKPKLLANIPNQNGHPLNGEYVIKPNLVNDHTSKSVEETKATVMTQVLTSIQLGVKGMLSFAMAVPGFQELDSEDQASLLKASRFDIWYVGHIRCFNCTLMVGACEWEFHAEELAQVWGADLVELIFRMSRQGNLLDFSTEEIAVLRAVCLTFTDRCPTLKERQRVEQIHSFLWDVLKYVVSRRHNDFNHWLSKTVNFLCLLREFGIKFESASSQLTLDWEVLSDNPLLLSAFLS